MINTPMLIILLVTSLMILPVPVLSETSDSTTVHSYPEDFLEEYFVECRKLAIAEGLSEEDAQVLCDCTINKFQSQYSFEEYQQLTPEQREEIGYACFEDILYEEE